MAISGTSTDYTGRKKDIHIFQGVVAPGSSKITLGFGSTSNFCAGVQKLVQRYAITLLTELGSQTEFPDFGSTLLTRLQNSALNLNIADVRGLYNLANAKVVRQFRAYQSMNSNGFLDEELNTAYLQGVNVYNSQVSLKIKIVSRAGDPVVFVVPLPDKQ